VLQPDAPREHGAHAHGLPVGGSRSVLQWAFAIGLKGLGVAANVTIPRASRGHSRVAGRITATQRGARGAEPRRGQSIKPFGGRFREFFGALACRCHGRGSRLRARISASV